MSRVFPFLLARLRAILIAAVFAVGLYSYVGYNHSRQAALETTLAEGTLPARDAAVQGLVQNGRLIDTLINTQDPDEDVTSPHNQRSLLMRKHAVESVSRLSADGKLPPSEAFDTLFLICKDADLDVKASAEAGLTGLGRKSDANLKAVVDRLSNGDPDIRSAAEDVLGLIGGPKTADLVNRVLPNTASQDAAIIALEKIGAPSVPLVTAHLEDPAMQNDIVFRQQMVNVLDQIAVLDQVAAPASVPELIKIAGLPNQPSVQRLAQVALADTMLAAYAAVQTAKITLAAAKDQPAKAAAQTALAGASAALPAAQLAEPTLRGVLVDTSADSESRSQAALALGHSGSLPAIAVLVAALGDFDSQVRDAAQTGLQSSGPAAVGPLSAALASGEATKRAAAAQALGGLGGPAAIAALESALHSPSAPDVVRESAAVSLGRSGDPRVIPALVAALGDRDGIVAGAAQTGLLTPALEKPAIPALVAALSGQTPAPFNAADTLSRMGTLAESDVVPRLTQSIATASAPTQTWAAITLGEIGSKSAAALSALQGLAKSSNPQVQYAASQSLLKIAGG